MSQIFLLALKELLRMLYDRRYKYHRDWKNQKCHDRHQWTDAQHHHQNTNERCHRSDQLRCTLVQTLAERIHIIRHSGEYLSVCRLVKIFHWQAVDFLGNFLSHAVCHFL